MQRDALRPSTHLTTHVLLHGLLQARLPSLALQLQHPGACRAVRQGCVPLSSLAA